MLSAALSISASLNLTAYAYNSENIPSIRVLGESAFWDTDLSTAADGSEFLSDATENSGEILETLVNGDYEEIEDPAEVCHNRRMLHDTIKIDLDRCLVCI